MLKRIFFLLLIISALFCDELGDTKQKIDNTKKKIDVVKTTENTLLSQLENLSQSLSQVNSEIEELNAQIDMVNFNISENNSKKNQIENKLKKNRKNQSNIIKNMYITRRSRSSLPIVMKFNEVSRITRFLKYFHSVADYRKDIIVEFITLNDSLEIVIEESKTLRTNLFMLSEQQESVKDSLSNMEQEYENTLVKIQGEKQEYLEALKILEEQEKEIERRIALQNAMKTGKFPKKIPWPVNSKEILHKFGLNQETRYNTEFYNPGIDIKAKAGEDVFAVVDGDVEYTGWLRGYGNIIILRHSEGYYTLYGNLERISVKKGEKILTGTKIGIVSPYGWLEGAKIHFEIRNGKQEVDPARYLE